MSIFDTLFLTGYNTVAQPTLQSFDRAFNQAVYDPNARERQVLGMLNEFMRIQQAQQDLQLDPLRVGATVTNAQVARDRFDDRLAAEERLRERLRQRAELARQGTVLGGLMNFAPEAAAGIDPNDPEQVAAALGRAPGVRLSRVGREAYARAGSSERAKLGVREDQQRRQYLGEGVLTDTLDERRGQLDKIGAAGGALPAPKGAQREQGLDIGSLMRSIGENPNASISSMYDEEAALRRLDLESALVKPSQQHLIPGIREKIEAQMRQRAAGRGAAMFGGGLGSGQ